MTLFEFIMVLVSFIIGTSVTELLAGIADTRRLRKAVHSPGYMCCSVVDDYYFHTARKIWVLAGLAVMIGNSSGP